VPDSKVCALCGRTEVALKPLYSLVCRGLRAEYDKYVVVPDVKVCASKESCKKWRKRRKREWLDRPPRVVVY
jgi:hypothetical protein